MTADALSDVLKTVRMTGAAFFNVVGTTPWVAEQPTREMVLPLILPGAENLIAYHIVTEGHCVAQIIGGESVELTAGQVVVFTRGDAHVMASSPGMRADPVPPGALTSANVIHLPFFARYGDNGPPSVKLVCGFLACDARPFNPLLENLPTILVADSSKAGEMPWLGQLVRLAMSEASDKRAGSESVLGRLTELMFIEVVRRYLENLPPEQAGWLAGLRDPSIGRALSLLHADPSRNWTLEELASRVGSSRSEFAERFASFVGQPAMQYLAKWRMQLASGLLRDNVNIAAIAAEVGYSSESSFSRAFKKIVGVPPSLWRNSEPKAVKGALPEQISQSVTAAG